jgi:hypothetical protein
MRPNEVVVDLETRKDWGISPLDSPHHLFAVSHLSIEPFHLVVIDCAIESDILDVLGVAVAQTEFALEREIEVLAPIRGEDKRNLASDSDGSPDSRHCDCRKFRLLDIVLISWNGVPRRQGE